MSTTKIIKYQDSGAFTFDSDLVEIDATGARLKPITLAADQLLLATGRVGQPADLGASLPIYNVGSAVWNPINGYDTTIMVSGSYFSLNDDSGRDGITPLTPTSHFDVGQIGTFRFKAALTYAGSPAFNRYIFSTGDTTVNNGNGSLISLYHNAAGDLQLVTRNNLGTGTSTKNMGAFAAVSGLEQEWELGFDTFAGTYYLFIDGILQASAISSAINIAPRDYFYLGNSNLTIGSTSQVRFHDLQIFNTIQHTTNFPLEIPRVVGLYPLEALIVPSETSVAEGFISVAEGSTLPDDTVVQYLMRIESANYWIDSFNNLVVSDGTLAESNTLADWNLPANVATVTAFVVAGARITMLPILSSGSIAISTPDLDATTLTYDFFAIPETCITCTLYGFVKDNCDDIVSGTVRVYTKPKKSILTQGNLVGFDETVDIELPNGFFEMNLVRPNLISVATSTTPSVPTGGNDTYFLEAEWTDSDGIAYSYKADVLIPDQSSVLLYDAVTAAEAL